MVTLKTIDAHAEGGPLRLAVDGFPAPRGRTMADKTAWVRRHADTLRRVLMREPRGHADMCGAVLTEPVAPGSHAGVIFMNAAGYPALSGHGLIALATVVLERRLLVPGGDGMTIACDTEAGTVRARAAGTPERVDRVTLVNLPSFVAQGGVAVKAAGRPLRADVAFAGRYYAIVDSEATGLAVDPSRIPELRRAGMAISGAVDAVQAWVHPDTGREEHIAGTIFTAPPRSAGADLRSVTVSADGQVGRSPGGTGTAALMTVLEAMGLLGEDRPFVHEGILGTRLLGRVAGRNALGGLDGIVVDIEGSAWITGEHTLVAASGDPLADGVSVP
jgi:trans-L-3-hydroxyproline dehydratase